jgi:hypothetical protein
MINLKVRKDNLKKDILEAINKLIHKINLVPKIIKIARKH